MSDDIHALDNPQGEPYAKAPQFRRYLGTEGTLCGADGFVAVDGPAIGCEDCLSLLAMGRENVRAERERAVLVETDDGPPLLMGQAALDALLGPPRTPRLSVYLDFNDWWIGAYRGPNHWYVCPLPCVVIRWRRRSTLAGDGSR